MDVEDVEILALVRVDLFHYSLLCTLETVVVFIRYLGRDKKLAS